MTPPHEVVAFWREAGAGKWFNGGEAFDRECLRFLDAHHAAARREHAHWQDTAEGLVALLILLDQIPRNIFRGSGHAFATDPLALHYAGRALAAGHDHAFETTLGGHTVPARIALAARTQPLLAYVERVPPYRIGNVVEIARILEVHLGQLLRHRTRRVEATKQHLISQRVESHRFRRNGRSSV